MSKNAKTKTVEEKYSKMSQHDHILALPDTYVDSLVSDVAAMWIYDEELERHINKNITFNPGLYKIFDEILVNARDQTVRDKTCNIIKVDVNIETGEISCYNNGKEGIEIQIHKEHNIYVPELIFGHLLTSSNYNTEKKDKTVGGKNGFGAKLTNIFSKKFYIEIIDMRQKKMYQQTFSNNMYTRDDPIITTIKKKAESYTMLKFTPDFKRFGMDGLTEDFVNLFRKRTYDIAGTTKNVEVYFNGELLKVNSFEDYIDMFLPVDELSESSESKKKKQNRVIYETDNYRWEVGIVYDPSIGHRNISYVNGICTSKGGTHLNYILDQIYDGLKDKPKIKKLNIKPSQIKEHLSVFINCVIEEPAFNSQTKEALTTKKTNFGSVFNLSDDFITKVGKTGILDYIVDLSELRDKAMLSKTSGKKVSSLKGIKKLDDANLAGTRKSNECVLILTEGDSAKATAIAGLQVIGRDRYGVFPLRGKLINPDGKPISQLKDNEEIKNIVGIMGLEYNKVYTKENIGKLRYGKILILTDQDLDGDHIKGLLINFINYFWKDLLKLDGDFICTLDTPLIRLRHKRKKNTEMKFYDIQSYEKFINAKDYDSKDWFPPKYYKGLGTMERPEAIECFSEFHEQRRAFIWKYNDDKEENKSEDAISKAFNKKRADDRKEWLIKYDKDNSVDFSKKLTTFYDFIDKQLIHFSYYDIIRSIPSAIDGLKPSQRKILFGLLKRNSKTNSEYKVAQLSGYIAENTAYHHGEVSIQETIIGMAQDFVGSNNINLLYPAGQFGTRLVGGSDSSSPRYIFTKLSSLTQKIFIDYDNHVYEYAEDDGKKVEPLYYVPILPMVLINGAKGIGTGWSTDIPCYNPIDVLENTILCIKNKPMKELIPYYRGFKGSIRKIEDKKYVTQGCYNIIDKKTLEITELPIGTWTSPYKDDFLSTLDVSYELPKNSKQEAKKYLVDYVDNGSDINVKIKLTFDGNQLQVLIREKKIDEELKLISKISTTNMHLRDRNGIIKKYDDPNDIIKDFCIVRLETYDKRREYCLKLFKNELELISWKVKFLEYYMDGKITFYDEKGGKRIHKKEEDMIEMLEGLGFPRLSGKIGNEEEKEEENEKDDKSYNYITRLPIWSLTSEKLEKLKEELDEKTNKYNDYSSKSSKDLWVGELDAFKTAYVAWLKEREKQMIESEKKIKSSQEKKTKKK